MLLRHFSLDGFVCIPGVLSPNECESLASLVRPGARASGGTRCLLAEAWCSSLASRLREHPLLSQLIPNGHVAVQCTYFEKSASRNWLVPIHQDLSIPVARRVQEPSLSGWSAKEGAWFVHAPASILANLVAVRLHLDSCKADDGALHVLPGSHSLGRVHAKGLRSSANEITCEFAAGGALAMRPLLLHSSSKATGASRRRVLHFVFGPSNLPHGLEWHHTA